ncbi:hypothetical protein RIB2604_01200270 [Aspergillus luchuensis]|uniref:Uncharacterized protein n=1 Tax=Aspergillus kawachii TaxID=1069201 RepID=A0A146F769_ASPKA|nr:hypothetical protein RIB2604_01200270 [Aspergillus luchuensis]
MSSVLSALTRLNGRAAGMVRPHGVWRDTRQAAQRLRTSAGGYEVLYWACCDASGSRRRGAAGRH